MNHQDNMISDLKIAYIGGGSRGWAWTLMKDLALAETLSGQISLYDIDFSAARDNEIIGNRLSAAHPQKSKWVYKAVKHIDDALTDADFVIISILPGTFEEMESDVHTPENYGIYQPVGDTVGPGGIIRSLRTIPMFETIALAVKQYCPEAWVINYTNPMSVCVKTLYSVFPEIKAFGCCHELFGTLNLFCKALDEISGIRDVERNEIKVNVFGVNHFTWIDEAKYKNIDLMPIYREYAKRHRFISAEDTGDDNWMNKVFESHEFIKFDLFSRFGFVAAAGDRHLAEFCPAAWYTKTPETIQEYGFGMTSVEWRRNDLADRMKKSLRLKEGTEDFELGHSGEEGVRQIKALLGQGDLITNVNLVNNGQIPNLPLGTVVETNAAFTSDSVRPIIAGEIPDSIYGLVAPIIAQQNLVVEAGLKRDLNLAFQAFIADPHVQCLTLKDARALFDEMIHNTRTYLHDYFETEERGKPMKVVSVLSS